MPEVKFNTYVGNQHVMCRFKWDYPIVNLMSGHIRGCCRTTKQVITQHDIDTLGKDAILNRPYELERRLEKMKGITHEDCASCIRLQHSGITPPREGIDVWFKEYWDKNKLGESSSKSYSVRMAELTQNLDINSPILKSNHPDMLEIVLGNTCNLKCTYCSAHYSSQWASELIQNGEMSHDQYKHEFPQAPPGLSKIFWEWFYDVARHSTQTINILGGEPTYIPGFYDVLEKLIAAYQDLGKKDRRVELGVISNLNTSPTALNKLISYLPELGKHFLFRLQPSMESMYQRAEYIRYGIKWSLFEDNVRTLLKESKRLGLSQDQFSMGFQMALNAFSVSSLPDFITWVNELNQEFDVELGLMKNIVSFPRHHNPMILTPDFATFVKEAIDYIQIYEVQNDRIAKTQRYYGSWHSYRVHLLEDLHTRMIKPERNEFDIESRIRFYEFIRTNDRRRGCNFRKSFPEYETFYQLCRSISPHPADDDHRSLEAYD